MGYFPFFAVECWGRKEGESGPQFFQYMYPALKVQSRVQFSPHHCLKLWRKDPFRHVKWWNNCGFGKWLDGWDRTLTARGSGRSLSLQWEMCWCLEDRRICRCLKMHKLQQCEKTHQRQMVRSRVSASIILLTLKASVDPVTHWLGGDQTIHCGSRGLCHA